MQATLADDILECWFGDAVRDAGAAQARNKLWFGRDARFDALLAERFGDLPRRMRQGVFDAWMQAPRTSLARIIVLDQFPRNIFRASPEAYAFDQAALSAAIDAVAKHHDDALHPLEAVFMYLPFEHAEDPSMQARAVQLFESLQRRAPRELTQLFASFTDYAHRHAAVVSQFGRFPHRNEALGRASTSEENAYLAAGGQRF